MNILERIRNKPPHVKTQIAFAGAGIATLVVGAIWASTIGVRLQSAQVAAGIVADTEGTESFIDLLKGAREDITAAIEGVTEKTPPNEDRPSPYDSLMEDFMPETVASPAAQTSTLPTTQAELFAGEGTTTSPTPIPRVILIATTTAQKDE